MRNLFVTTAVSLALMGVVSAAQADAGQKTYMSACFACHGTGAAGAPVLGNKAMWKDRIAQGTAILEEHALKGYKGAKGFMPAKGGRMDLSDADVKAAVAYMVSKGK